jgi:ribonuclease P protein component
VEQRKQYTLGKQERLKSRKTIDLLFKAGKSFSIFPLRVIYQLPKPRLNTTGGKLQAGFTVGNKHFKKATDRNRIRRLMREAYRLQKNLLHAQLSENGEELNVFFVYTAKEKTTYETILAKMKLALDRLSKITGEPHG